MKEEKLRKHLDNILINGLIKEAERENADFETAMRSISDSEFGDIVMADNPANSRKTTSRWQTIRPWILSVASAAAVILAVLIPSVNSMNARLCDSALYMSQDYISASKGGLDLSTATTDQIKAELPSLKQRYESLLQYDNNNQPVLSQECADAAWDLTVVYLRLHKKGDAIKLLKTIVSQTQGTPMGDHCAKLLEQLD